MKQLKKFTAKEAVLCLNFVEVLEVTKILHQQSMTYHNGNPYYDADGNFCIENLETIQQLMTLGDLVLLPQQGFFHSATQAKNNGCTVYLGSQFVNVSKDLQYKGSATPEIAVSKSYYPKNWVAQRINADKGFNNWLYGFLPSCHK